MKSSRKNKETRSVFDVRTTQEKFSFFERILTLFHDGTINLRPKFRVRHPWVASGAALILIILAVLGISRLFVSAEVADFYPVSCLGTWQSPERAQGEPESLRAAAAPIDATTSAVFLGPISQIFCGSFVAQRTDTSGDIQSVGLTLVWNMTGLPTSTADTSTTTVSSPPQSLRFGVSPFTFIFPLAHAQDASTTDTSTTGIQPAELPLAITPSVTNTTSTTATDSSLAPIATSTASSSAADTSNETTSIPAAASTTISTPPPPDENFLLVSYSTDGNTWIPLQKVNPRNWNNLTTALPITQWSDLQKLQIKIEGIPTALASPPQVFLDGMFMEVHYNLPPVIGFQGGVITNTTSSEARVIHVSPNVTIETPAIASAPFVPPPTIVAVEQTATIVSVTVQYVGDYYGNPLYLYLYPAHTTAERNDGDSAYTFAGEPQEGPSIDPWPLDVNAFDPTTKQATFILVDPSPKASGPTIATAAMIPGDYAIDISYYDSVTWHVIPAQTFTWP